MQSEQDDQCRRVDDEIKRPKNSVKTEYARQTMIKKYVESEKIFGWEAEDCQKISTEWKEKTARYKTFAMSNKNWPIFQCL